MIRRDVRQIRAALNVVRESEALMLHLRISAGSISSSHELFGAGLECYIKKTKKSLHFQLILCYVKIAFTMLSKTIVSSLRGWWLRITEHSPSEWLMK